MFASPEDDERHRSQWPCGAWADPAAVAAALGRLGVLLAVAPVADEATQRRCAWPSTLAAELLVSKSAFGDRLLFHTDGVREARSPDGHAFGAERLAARLQALARTEIPAEVMRRLCQKVVEFAGGHLEDDATLLLVSFGGDGVDPTLPIAS